MKWLQDLPLIWNDLLKYSCQSVEMPWRTSQDFGKNTQVEKITWLQKFSFVIYVVGSLWIIIHLSMLMLGQVTAASQFQLPVNFLHLMNNIVSLKHVAAGKFWDNCYTSVFHNLKWWCHEPMLLWRHSMEEMHQISLI